MDRWFRRSGSVAWACPTLTANATMRNLSRRFIARSNSVSTFSTRLTSTARAQTKSWSAAPFVASAIKFGIVQTANTQVRGVNGRPEYVRAACDASLKRLGVDTIDLYYQHRVD